MELVKAAKRGRPKGAYSGNWVVQVTRAGQSAPDRFYRADLFEQRMRYWTKHGVVVSKIIWRVHPTKVVGSGRAGNTQAAVDGAKAHIAAQQAKGHAIEESVLEDVAAAAEAITAAADQLAATQPGRAATMREMAEPHLEVVEAAAQPGRPATAFTVARDARLASRRADKLRADAVRHNPAIAAAVEGGLGEGRAQAPAGPGGVLGTTFDQIRAQILERNFAKLTQESKTAIDALIDRLEGKTSNAPGTYTTLHGGALTDLDPDIAKRPMSALLTMGAVGSRIGSRIAPPTMHHADGTPFTWRPIWYKTREWDKGNINWFTTRQERQLLSEYEGFIVQKAYEHVRAYFPTGESTISDEERLAVKHDAQQQGRMILLDLARTYDPTKEVPFVEWATSSLDGHIQNFVFEEKKQHMLQHGQYTQDQIDNMVDPEQEYAKEVMGRLPMPEEHALYKEAVEHTLSVFGASEHTMGVVRALILNGSYGPAVFRVAGGTRDEIATAYHRANENLKRAQAEYSEAEAEAKANKKAVLSNHPAKQKLHQAQAEYLTEFARARLVQDVAKMVTEQRYAAVYPRIEEYVNRHHLSAKETYAFLAFMDLSNDHSSKVAVTTANRREAVRVGGNPIELPTQMERVGGHLTRRTRYLMAANSESEVARMAAAAGLGTEAEWRLHGPSYLRAAMLKLGRLPASQQQELRTVLATMARRATGQLAELYSVPVPTADTRAPVVPGRSLRAATLAQRRALAASARTKTQELADQTRNRITTRKNKLTAPYKIIHEAQSKVIREVLGKQGISIDQVDWGDDQSAGKYQSAYTSAAKHASEVVRRNPKGKLKRAIATVKRLKSEIAEHEGKHKVLSDRINRLDRYARTIEVRQALAQEAVEGERSAHQMYVSGDVKKLESEIDGILALRDPTVRRVIHPDDARLSQLRGQAAAKRAKAVTDRGVAKFHYITPRDAMKQKAAEMAAASAAAAKKPKKGKKKGVKKSISAVGDEMLAKSVLDFADDAMDKDTTHLAAEVMRIMLDLRAALGERE